jgi:hypothetical protein
MDGCDSWNGFDRPRSGPNLHWHLLSSYQR